MKRIYFTTLAVALMAMPAQAHVTANPNQGPAGNYFQTSFRVTHGCDGSDTNKIQIKLPNGILLVHPQYKPGWTLELVTHKLDKPISVGHGKTTDAIIDEVIWTGGLLPDNQYDDFGLVMKLPDQVGQTLWFPMVQTCTTGSNRWVEIPKANEEWHHLPRPAPFVKLIRNSTH